MGQILTLREESTPTGHVWFDAARLDSPLVVTDRQIRVARSNKAAAIVWMKPIDFLRLSTWGGYTDSAWDAKHSADDFEDVLRPNLIQTHGVQPIEVYNDLSRRGTILLMPMLGVERDTGQVDEHEGRHRAAALLRDFPKARYPVAIILKEGRRAVRSGDDWEPVRAADIPRELHPQKFLSPALRDRTKAVQLDDAALETALDLQVDG